MPRVIFNNPSQSNFLRFIKAKRNLTTEKLALIANVSPRTFRDWLRGKYTISSAALMNITNECRIPLPTDIKLVDDFWYVSKGARRGALRRLELHGQLGTYASRKKGGTVSQLRRRMNPEKYKLSGCNVKKRFDIKFPSVEFAESAGIILGDGAITPYQVRITVSSLVDRPYANFIVDLFHKVFGEKPSLIDFNYKNTLALTLSGVELVEKLKKRGFKQGNKVRQQVDFPHWVWKNIKFQKACVRGLFDTDGGLYFHKHTTKGISYKNLGWNFHNYSVPLVQSVAKVLKSLGIKYSLADYNRSIYIYRFEEIKKYFAIIGSNNLKNHEKFNYYINQKTHRI